MTSFSFGFDATDRRNRSDEFEESAASATAHGGLNYGAAYGRLMRNRIFFALDIALLAAVVLVAFAARFEGLDAWRDWGRAATLFTLVAVPLKMALFYRAGIYRRLWRYASIADLEI